MEHAELREQALEANLALGRTGLVILTFGNASAVDRAGGVMAIKPSGVPYERLTAAEITVVDLASGAAVGGENRPSSDTPTHLALYRAWGEVGGIVHTHSPFATSWAQACREIPCFGTTHADHFDGAVPVTRALTPREIDGDYERETGEVIIESFAARERKPLELPGVLVASHGPFTWGSSAGEAVENAVALEAVAAAAYRSVVLAPELQPISPELLRKHFSRKHGSSAYYGQPE